jgi:hypothetical protein
MSAENRLNILHKLLPLWLRSSLTPLFQCIYLHCFRFRSAGELDDGIHLAYLGMSRARARVWAKRICGDSYIEDHYAPRIWCWSIDSYLRKQFPDCNLRLIETCKLTEVLLAGKPGFKIPMWIQLALDTTRSIEQLKRASQRMRDEIPRTIRKYGLRLELSTDAAKVEPLIEQMHIPYIKGRHQENAFLPSKDAVRVRFKDSEMLFIKIENETIAGIMLHCLNNVASLHYIGVKDNRLEYLKKGCVGAMYYFAILRSIERGMPTLHFGGTSPFLTDSLTFFKLSFRPHVIANTFLPDYFVNFSLRRKTPQLLAFLRKNPFISTDGKGAYYRNVYLDSTSIQSVNDLDDVFKKIPCGNIARTRIYVQGDPDHIGSLLKTDEKYRDTDVLPY